MYNIYLKKDTRQYMYLYDYEISLFGHRRKKNEHNGIINNKMVETTVKILT